MIELSLNEKRILKKLGMKIRKLRNDHEWTLEMAEQHGGYPSWRHLQRVEIGKNFTIVTLLRVSSLYGLKPSELLKSIGL